MPSIAERKRDWYFAAKDRLDRCRLWCNRCSSTKGYDGEVIHATDCPDKIAFRDWARYAEVGRPNRSPQETSVRNFSEGYSGAEED